MIGGFHYAADRIPCTTRPQVAVLSKPTVVYMPKDHTAVQKPLPSLWPWTKGHEKALPIAEHAVAPLASAPKCTVTECMLLGTSAIHTRRQTHPPRKDTRTRLARYHFCVAVCVRTSCSGGLCANSLLAAHRCLYVCRRQGGARALVAPHSAAVCTHAASGAAAAQTAPSCCARPSARVRLAARPRARGHAPAASAAAGC